jgi:hypothetical protein
MPTARRRLAFRSRRKAKGSIIKDQFASNTPEDVAVMLRPLTEALARRNERRSNRMYFLFTMAENPRSVLKGKTPARKAKPCFRTRPRNSQRLQKAWRPPSGGARRDRTDDLVLAKHALSQLSYGPFPGGAPKGQIRECALLSAGRWRPKWWAWEDLNFRPHAYQARALTN